MAPSPEPNAAKRGLTTSAAASSSSQKPSAASIHTIPVPRGWSVEQAWEAISRGDLLTDPDPDWGVVRVENNLLVKTYTFDEGDDGEI